MLSLTEAEWRELEAGHEQRADEYTRAWRERTGPHPVDDFLFTYYPFRASHLRRWHPGAGVLLEGGSERLDWRWYRPEGEGVTVDDAAFFAKAGRSIRFIVSLLESTAARPANFGCFGLHEWAMVYRAEEQNHELRHDVPLRLSAADTDAVVDSHHIACTHIDAFRFFTPEAVPLNRLQPTRENQPELEQSGCLHAGMDVYKWATKLGPLVPGDVLLDCFELARDIRRLDMRASPYDLRDWGFEPVAIETTEGKAEYVRAQRGFTERGDLLRRRVVQAVSSLHMLQPA